MFTSRLSFYKRNNYFSPTPFLFSSFLSGIFCFRGPSVEHTAALKARFLPIARPGWCAQRGGLCFLETWLQKKAPLRRENRWGSVIPPHVLTKKTCSIWNRFSLTCQRHDKIWIKNFYWIILPSLSYLIVPSWVPSEMVIS